jgi:hypothetical protein
MRQTTTTEEAKSKVDKKPQPSFTSLTKLPHWFIIKFVLSLDGMWT